MAGADPFLAPLTALARKAPDLDAFVFWAAPDWLAEPSDELDAEELPFYLEGLLDQGLALFWRILAAADAPLVPDHVRAYVGDPALPPPPPAPGWVTLAEGKRG